MNAPWSATALIILVVALLLFFWRFERRGTSSKEVALIASLAALAALSRVPFAIIPNVQPTTFLVILSGYVFGWQTGFMVGAIAAVVSNMFLGQGPWTPWQMVAWGLAGASAGLLRQLRPRLSMAEMVIFQFIWGYLFGWLMNLWSWLTYVYPLTWQSWMATQLASITFDSYHAIGNSCFTLLLGRRLIAILERFRRRLSVRYEGNGTAYVYQKQNDHAIVQRTAIDESPLHGHQRDGGEQ